MLDMLRHAENSVHVAVSLLIVSISWTLFKLMPHKFFIENGLINVEFLEKNRATTVNAYLGFVTEIISTCHKVGSGYCKWLCFRVP